MRIEDELNLVRFNVDSEPHIKVLKERCQDCSHHACTYCCPANCYELVEGGLIFSYEGCLECGTCNIICDRGAIQWNHPRGGFGVCYRYV